MCGFTGVEWTDTPTLLYYLFYHKSDLINRLLYTLGHKGPNTLSTKQKIIKSNMIFVGTLFSANVLMNYN